MIKHIDQKAMMAYYRQSGSVSHLNSQGEFVTVGSMILARLVDEEKPITSHISDLYEVNTEKRRTWAFVTHTHGLIRMSLPLNTPEYP